MKEQLQLNKLPVNQTAKKMLEKAGENPNPMFLYLQQLLSWSLETGELQTIPEVEDRIGQMILWKPKTWMVLDEIESQYRVQTG